ncbi:alpha/beta fold hydrolase [Spirosoma koreense]
MSIVESTQGSTDFRHSQVVVEGVSIHVVTVGQADRPAVLFLHGFPENWQAFEKVMAGLGPDFYLVTIDLPGVGESGKIPANDKRTIARYVHGVVHSLQLTNVTLVGHDVGGMVTYAYLHDYPTELTKAVIMNVAVPSVDPWAKVRQNPQIWHFTFHSIPELPEALIMGKQRVYFDYYFNTIAAKPDQIDEQARDRYAQAYASPDALHTGIEWYRTFPQDEKENESTKGQLVQMPVLYIRGGREYGDIDEYLDGFRRSGLVNIQGEIIPGSGHYAPEEAPGEVVQLLKEFI